MRVIDAVGASDLPQDLRLLVFALAYLANSKTGIGLSGQDTIGKFMGCTGREVRRKLERLDTLSDAPVRVIRRHRSRRDGRGRSSDEYQLELFSRTPASAETASSKGRERPVATKHQPDVKHFQPDVKHFQPDAHVLGSSEKILGEDPRSKESATSALVLAPPTPKKKRAKVERPEEQHQAHRALTEFYFAEFEAVRGCKPIGWAAKEGKAVYDLLEKLKFDLFAAKRIVSNGLRSWDKATILTVAGNPSACVAGAGLQRARAGSHAGDFVDGMLQRAAALEAAERGAAQ
ncbi:MAG TPA: hypothetical protein VFK05_35125 [Polyangiaceae bacterium]|nr:hypothetical protein [Polyangiaceae bacterium]